MDNWNNRTEEEKDREFAQEPTSLVENRKIPLPHLGFPHQQQDTLDIAKNASTPNVRKRPVQQRSKDFPSR